MTDTQACPTRIDTKIDADGKQIFAAANWLKDAESSFRGAADDVSQALKDNFRSLSGEFGEAVKSYGREFMHACYDAADELKNAANIIEAWGDQIKWRKEDMAQCRDAARKGGLEVHGEVITLPPASSGSDADDFDQRQKRKIMSMLAREVKEIRDMLTKWVYENMVINARDLRLFSIVGEKKDVAIVQEVVGTTTLHPYVEDLDKMSRENLERRGKDTSLLLAEGTDAEKKVDDAWKRANTFSARLLAGLELATSDKPGETGASLVSGSFAKRVTKWVTKFTGKTSPMGIFVETVGIPIITKGGSYAYENIVSLRTRERINEHLRDLRGYNSHPVDKVRRPGDSLHI